MKSSKNETDMLALIQKMQGQLDGLDKKLDTLIMRSALKTTSLITPSVHTASATPAGSNDRNKGRTMYAAICADCKKECSIPFKPSGDRPVYCKECFSRRKTGGGPAKLAVGETPKEVPVVPIPIAKVSDTPKAPVKNRKKPAAVKKPAAKKKSVPKKK
jgi:CxxC-x17-CxxC domain-containing protein